MRASVFLLPALSASVWAAPTFPKITAAVSDNVQALSQYFNLVASKVQQSRILGQAPVCDLPKVSLPAAAAGLPPPSPGLYLKHIAIGRGTQNYTCDLSNSTAVPQAAGAVATLFNASCVAATYPDVGAMLTRASLQFDLSESEALQRLAPSNLGVSGAHYFTTLTTPYFDINTPQWQLGASPFGKNASIAAPADAGKGLKGEGAVALLKLSSKPGGSGGLQEVYRVETVGGSPPATCQGMPATFEIQYSTQYWFYASKA
ncbi:hypothetical protein QBC35DRAFT_426164 [Podospora australis]|uniref:Malate dehydrogenase n=1 Tax=Podospora australis TaxID=1536484 RepID=A0AAN7AMB8_9PEZI|nr:hypothetical protein QBC35DRAFT_426164 [Podospora australis]